MQCLLAQQPRYQWAPWAPAFVWPSRALQWKVRADGRLRAGRTSDIVSSPVAQPVDFHATRSMDGFRRLFNLGFKARFVLCFL